MNKLQTYDARESALLAPYAMFSCQSRGRKHEEPSHPYRSPFQRDRDRIVHSAAYRRLSGKMQVFTGSMGDYHRTRLTHTYEVASIARTIGRVFRLNEDLVEALALFHDIGHPPFGHAGEDALAACLQDEGGFSHNQFALAIAEELESRYHRFPGLNLTYEVLDGQQQRIDKKAAGQQPCLEVQLVDQADSAAYDAHDTDDAVKLGLVALDEFRPIPLVREAIERVERNYAGATPSTLRKAVTHELIDRQVTDLLQNCGDELLDRGFGSNEEARESDFRIEPSPAMRAQKEELETFLYDRVYRHPRLIEVRADAQQRLQSMFAVYIDGKAELPGKYRRRVVQVGMRRATAEYLASMTDRYCDEQYQVLCKDQAGD